MKVNAFTECDVNMKKPYRNIKYVLLLSFAWIFLPGHCQLDLDSPFLVRLSEREWYIIDTEPIGSKVAQAYVSDYRNDLVFKLEPLEVTGGNNTFKPLPFMIDPNTGVVSLNDSVEGRAGENLRLWVTASNGKHISKAEAWVRIVDKSYKPTGRIPGRGGFSPNGMSNFPGFNIPGSPWPDNNGYPGRSPYLNQNNNPYQNNMYNSNPPLPGSTYKNKTSSTYQPEFGSKDDKQKVGTTHLKPINDNNKTPKIHVEKSVTLGTSTEAIKKNDSQVLLPDKTEKPEPDLTATLVPLISVFSVFCIVGVVAFVFRKKIQLGRVKCPKDEKKKQPNGNVVLQENSSLALQSWRGPRAFSNRYEPWEGDNNHSQMTPQVSTTVKNNDKWEFPRHRLKFFNIIGEGAFGQVWKCEALDIDGKDSLSIVAVKTLKENANDKERSDLLSEMQVMKGLEPHPNVVRLIGCCSEKEPVFLIMEYISGGKLQSYLRSSRAERHYNNMHGQSKSLTSRDLTSFAYQIARGMEFLAGNGIIHRDLAARNILITEDHTCKVADFGFARDVISSHVYERKSEGRLPIRWMAPESLYDNIFSVKSDVWSFGVLIWEIVTLGSTPYPGLSAAEVMKKVRDGYRLDKPEHCRRELYNIMYYCWAADPKHRPSFTECIELLEKLLLTETDYIELERFPDHSYYNVMSLSGEKL